LTDAELCAYARVILQVGLCFQPGKDVAINALAEHAPLVRTLAEEAYQAGATYVDTWYWEPHGKASRLRHAADDTLGWIPPWLDQRYRDLGERQGTLIMLVGDPEPDLLADVDGARAGLDRLPAVPSRLDIQTHGKVEWTYACYPTPAWAERVMGSPDAEGLWQTIRTVMRLNDTDPVAAWKARLVELDERCERLTAAAFDAIRFDGPNTDLTVGLLPRHRWGTAEIVSRAGIRHVAALPTEEVFTTPDPTRTNGTISATKPLALGGSVIRDLELRFVDGRIVEVAASSGADVVRGHIATDEGAALLGEIALVDDSSPLQQSGLLFYETLLDESAASHIAWGSGIPDGHQDYDPTRPETGDALPINRSATHTDFMVGSPDVNVTGVHSDGRTEPIMRGERWVL
jgi:aminopeptidase